MQISTINTAFLHGDQFSCLKIVTISTITILSFFLTFQLRAQPQNLSDPKKIIAGFEIVGGPSLSNFWGKDISDDQVLNLNFVFGIGVYHMLNEHFELDLRLLSEKKGDKTDYTSTFFDPDNNPTTYRFVRGHELKYFTAHISLKYYFGNQRRISVSAGGYLGFLQDSKTYTETYDPQGTLISYYYADDNSFENLDYGLTLALGSRISIAKRVDLKPQLMASMGLADIINRDLPNMDGYPVKNYSLSLFICIAFNTK